MRRACTRSAASNGISNVPFKYFAAHVLRLPEERADESGLTPQERGQFLHAVFERFFREWQAAGRGSITTENLADAVSAFEAIAERQLETLPESDRALERTYLLGSAAAPGLAERAFAFEIEQGGEVIERLLEHELEGTFAFQGAERRSVGPTPRKGGSNRFDGRRHHPHRRLQADARRRSRRERCSCRSTASARSRRSRDAISGRGRSAVPATSRSAKRMRSCRSVRSDKLNEALAAGQERLLGAVDGIERGEFPPDPEEPFLCTRCAYSTVCRKDYVGDE